MCCPNSFARRNAMNLGPTRIETISAIRPAIRTRVTVPPPRRGRRRRPRRGGGTVTRVLIAGLIALIVSILVGPRFIAFLRANEFGQHIREEGPQHHFSKQGTPTMGGLMIPVSYTHLTLPTNRE